jgi:antitoxin component of RelBE/YafQ-DinJ toxin-antitoxin module
MIRMTIRLADTLMREVRRVAAESGLTITTAVAVSSLASISMTPPRLGT